MRIALFNPSNPYTAWSMAGGIGATLRRMGHSVTEVTMPVGALEDSPRARQVIAEMRAEKPKLEELARHDLIIVSGPEHIGPWIEICYETYHWKNLEVPKTAWLHESCRREDYILDPSGFSWVADHFFFAGEQDADFQDQEHLLGGRSHWLPLGVDTEVFKPYLDDSSPFDSRCFQANRYTPVFDVAFIGLLYPKRQAMLQSLSRHQHPRIRIGRVEIHDLHGYDHEGSARRLASNYRQCKTFLNLPALSNMLVSKVYEIMACGTFLLTPELPEDGKKNMAVFESGRDLLYYSPSNVPRLAQYLREWVSPEMDAERQRIAENGCKLVHSKHSLEVRMTELLSKCGVSVAVQ